MFGGGLALYNSNGTLVGAIGVSGDTSCADHNIAWRARHNLNMDFVPAGVGTAAGRQHQLSGSGRGAESAERFLPSNLQDRRE